MQPLIGARACHKQEETSTEHVPQMEKGFYQKTKPNLIQDLKFPAPLLKEEAVLNIWMESAGDRKTDQNAPKKLNLITPISTTVPLEGSPKSYMQTNTTVLEELLMHEGISNQQPRPCHSAAQIVD